MKKVFTVFTALLLAFAVQAENLIENASFEKAGKKAPASWAKIGKGQVIFQPGKGIVRLESVDEKTPATFITASREDGCVPIKHSLAYATALEKAGVPFEIHIFEKGYHGYSLADWTVYSKAEEEYCAHLQCWFDLSIKWLYKRFEF